jgi:hypothetical protein
VGPQAGLIFDASGDLYGTTANGGKSATCLLNGRCGIVYELTRIGEVVWTEAVLHSSNGSSTDGEIPQAGWIFDARPTRKSWTRMHALVLVKVLTITPGRSHQSFVLEITFQRRGLRGLLSPANRIARSVDLDSLALPLTPTCQ